MDRLEEDRRSVFCGNLSPKVTEDILYELFLQAGPVAKVTIPKDQNGLNRSFGFILYAHPVSVNYAIELLNDIALFDRRIHVKRRINVADDLPPQAAQQGFPLNVAALTPMNLAFNTDALTLMDHSFLPQPGNIPFHDPRFAPFTPGVSAYPSQMGNFDQGFPQNQGYDWNPNQNYRNKDGDYDRGRDWNHDRNERNHNRKDWNHERNDRNFQRQDRDFNRRGQDRSQDRGQDRSHDRGQDRSQDRGHSRNEDRNFDRNRSRPDRDFDDRSNKHRRDFNRGYDRGSSSNDRSSSHSRKKDHYSSEYSSHSKRRRH